MYPTFPAALPGVWNESLPLHLRGQLTLPTWSLTDLIDWVLHPLQPTDLPSPAAKQTALNWFITHLPKRGEPCHRKKNSLSSAYIRLLSESDLWFCFILFYFILLNWFIWFPNSLSLSTRQDLFRELYIANSATCLIYLVAKLTSHKTSEGQASASALCPLSPLRSRQPAYNNPRTCSVVIAASCSYTYLYPKLHQDLGS